MPDAFPDRGAVRFRRQRDAGDVLNATLGLIRANARELARSYLAVVVPAALATGIATGLYMIQVGDVFLNPDPDDPLAVFNATYLGVIVFGLLASAVTAAAVGGYVRAYRRGETGALTGGELWEASKELVLPYLGGFLAVGAVLFLSVPILIVPCLGALAWLAFFVWLVPYVSVAYAARALEAPTLRAAWSRSRELVKGRWRSVMWALFVSGLVFYAIVLVLSVPLYVVMAVVGINSTGDPAAGFTQMGMLLAPLQALTYAAYLVPLLAAFFVHGRLVEEVEGTGLFRELDSLAGRPGPDDADAPADDGDGRPRRRPRRVSPTLMRVDTGEQSVVIQDSPADAELPAGRSVPGH